MLLHLVDAGGEHAGQSYKTIRKELEAYGAGLAEKAEIVALSKTDTVDDATVKAQIERLKRAMRTYGPALDAGVRARPPLLLSAATNVGVRDALRAVASEIDGAKREETAANEPEAAMGAVIATV